MREWERMMGSGASILYVVCDASAVIQQEKDGYQQLNILDDGRKIWHSYSKYLYWIPNVYLRHLNVF